MGLNLISAEKFGTIKGDQIVKICVPFGVDVFRKELPLVILLLWPSLLCIRA